MKKLFVVLFGVALLAGIDVQGQRGSLQGVWQAVEVTQVGPNARTVTITIPEPRPNLLIMTARHYSRVEVHAEEPRPMPSDVAKASADELRALWGPFVAEAGTYEETGQNVITMRALVAKNPAWMVPAAFSIYSYKVEGNTMWVTTLKNQNGPIANPVTVKAVRVE